ncbi:PAS domain-containing protein [Oceanobacillus sp. 143]|uniref:Sigma-54-dependent Fis family transcriptional regulator n=1 Tax=Oceanobacillus zhaokaii TaxID=2052660 RepID=A0A345PIE8_9BACI|nr:sigma 54-interacting transcriptional regulator [Oceanobacillus zhaokaii]AXI09778.1 sigma-54-dependent Fis family transcriptional regulator [Oceanobacillus zhaokaii]QGS69064.1 PAS domain-containing protein [Oceanobacillus sp. 143]
MSKSQYYLDAILAAEDDAITVITAEMKVLFWNDAAVKTYNIDQSAILHKPIGEFFHNDDLMVLKVLQTKKAVKNMYHQPRKDKHVVINASPIYNDENELIGAVSIERDISQIVKLNDNLIHTSTELSELRQKLITNNEDTPFSKLKGSSPALKQTIQIASKAAKTHATTLILGESGTGKEICARAIHEASLKSDGPFVPVNCGAIPSALFESELFGYEGGSFTGADKAGKAGKIEMADGGTIFLDEVGELPLDMQVKLLRVLQENVVYRIGDSSGKEINVRFVAATNQDLEQLMKEKKFRSDLFYRLNVIQIIMPPLRNRISDILELANFFLNHFAVKYQVSPPEMETDASQLLLDYHWPGNVRELRNLMERMIILSESSVIHKHDLLRLFKQEAPDAFYESKAIDTKKLRRQMDNIEKQLIEETLIEMNGNKSASARKLGISRVTLYNKIEKYGI